VEGVEGMTHNDLENAKKLLKKHSQGHLLAFWDRLNTSQRQALLAQIRLLNLARIDDWVAKYVKKQRFSAIPADFEPAPYYGVSPADPRQKRKYAAAIDLGRQLISAAKVAAFVVAGGQGTRLGFTGPKGDFPVSPVKNKTLFQIFAETITAVSKKYNAVCPWYIMTSPLNDAQTKEIFRSNDYYGLNEKNVFIFQQGTLPNFSFDGKILLADEANIACSPDGHGGSLRALSENGAISDMKNRGIELISYFQVDNPLVNVFDPLFIGLHVLDKAEMSSKAVIKTDPKEKVGNFCLVDGRVTVIEYSDLPDSEAEKRNPDGSLVFELGSIAIHIISTAFVEKLIDGEPACTERSLPRAKSKGRSVESNAEGFSLPLHRAVKKIPCIDASGNHIEPAEPNGIKLESFIFDALPLASASIILQTLRNEEFAPVKNETGSDSIETARELMIARAASWLESAGVAIPKKPDGSPDAVIEIAPAFAVERDDVKAKLSAIPPIKPKDKLYLT
ncbi:MAG: UDPGP type 1 family protein, partial [Sedimentisphaerales bacterium]|nr:UDPGP type 1 family protein [Sedimentisphaerales bacterium]